MELKTVWTEEVSVKTYETDFQMRWKPAAIFQVMQEAATHHASHLGYTYEAMISQNRIWILSRVKIRFFDIPGHQVPVTIRTWPKGIQQKLFFMRDFELTGAGGSRVAVATSAWVLINPALRRMLAPQSLPVPVPDNGGLSAIDETLERVSLPADLTERSRVRAGYSAVDQMGHVNNARYVEWISDAISFEQYSSRQLAWMQINYINEVKPGDEVSLSLGPNPIQDGTWAVQGVNRMSSGLAFEALLGWK